MDPLLNIHPDVAQALQDKQPVVALETSLLAHGFPWPDNLDVVQRMQTAVSSAGAVPAVVAIRNGRIQVGLDDDALRHFATAKDVAKASRRDMAGLLALGRDGATTVCGTLVAAHMSGIPVFATGGIGGVHRGGESSMDVSADLAELGRSPVVVVASGAKLILDLPRTLEVLETLGVTVVGYRTAEFPGFYVQKTGLPVDIEVSDPEMAARVATTHLSLGVTAVLVVNPVPVAHALDDTDVESWIKQALQDAHSDGIRGKAVTPYLLRRLHHYSEGWTMESNKSLLENNARVAGEIAAAMTQTPA